jgi:hypothetical protein
MSTEHLPVVFDDENPYRPKLVPQCNEKMDFMQERLQVGKYDINFIIGVLKIIHERCHRKDPDLSFTLSRNLEKLLAFLEIERDMGRK